MTLRFTRRGGYHGGRPIRPSLWCRRGESYIFSDFLRRNAGTNSTAGTSFDFLAGFTAFMGFCVLNSIYLGLKEISTFEKVAIKSL